MKWTKQPPPNTKISLSNPLGKKCIFFWKANDFRGDWRGWYNINFPTGFLISPETQDGILTLGAGSDAFVQENYVRFNSAGNTTQVQTLSGMDNLAVASSSSVERVYICKFRTRGWVSQGSDLNTIFGLGGGAGLAANLISGGLLRVYGLGVNQTYGTISDGDFHTVVLKHKASSVDVWLDGVPQTGLTGTSSASSSSRVTLAGDTGTSRYCNCDIEYMGIFDGQNFGQGQVDALMDNPYQVYDRPIKVALADPLPQTRVLSTPQVWDRQPPAGTPIDWDNPIAGEAAVIVTGLPGGTQEVYTNKSRGLVSAPLGRVATGWGQFPNYTSADDSWVASDYAFPFSSTDQFTALWVADWQGDNYEAAWQVEINAGGNPMSNFYASDAYGPITAGNYAQSTASWNPSGGIVPADFQQLHAAVFRFTGDWTDTATTGFDWWCNDKRSTGATRLASSIAGSLTNDTRIGRGSTAARGFEGPIGMFIFVPKALPDALCKSFAENPWQIFKKDNLHVPIEYKELTFDEDSEERLFMIPQKWTEQPK